MTVLLNTLFVTTPGSYLNLDHETVRVEQEGKLVKQLPLHPLGGITVFGHCMLSPALIERCLQEGRSIVYLTRNGRFAGRLEGPMSGNVLLRRAQHAALDSEQSRVHIARCFAAGKVHNARQLLLRGGREVPDGEDASRLRAAAGSHDNCLHWLEDAQDLQTVRGLEGSAAAAYFDVFNCLLKAQRAEFAIDNRNRRPPRDPLNALLSFLYTLLRGDCAAALESVGLDPQVGYLHALRPGRPALALDLMEELRPVLAERVALTLVNRKQLTPDGFEAQVGGAVYLSDRGRKTTIIEYQKRKQEELQHSVLGQKVPCGLVPHAQARLLARHLRGDIPHYPAFTWR